MAAVHDMTTGSPVRHILTFAIPLICGYVLQQMYHVVDSAIVGQFLGVNELAAVGASSSILFLILGFCNGACAGFAIPVAQSFGAKDYRLMRRYAANAVYISLLITVVLTIITTLYCRQILKWVSTPEEIMDDAYTFLLIVFLTIPFIVGYNLLAGFIRALGNSTVPFYILILSSIFNAVLAYVLIALVGMGVEGSSLATMVSQLLSVVGCAEYIRRKMPMLIPRVGERKIDSSLISDLSWQGFPMGLQFSITAIGSIMLQSANNALGTVCVAAFTASMRIKYLFTTVFENLGVAMATYCGQNLGARKLERISSGIRSAFFMMMAYFLFTVVIIQMLSEPMIMFFVDPSETQIISHGALFLHIACYFYPALGTLTILRYSIQGLGYSKIAIFSGVSEMFARAGVSIFLVPAFGFLGVCWGDPVAWVCADLFLIPAYYLIFRRLKAIENGK